MEKTVKKLSLTTAALAGAVLAGGTVVTHADTVDSKTGSTNVSATTQSNVKPAEQAVQTQQSKVANDTNAVNETKAQADSASATTKATSEAVANQQSVVNNDKTAVNNDQQNVSHWQSVASQATPSNISANQQAQTNQQATITGDRNKVANDQADVTAAQNKVNDAQSNLNDKKAEQSSAQTAYNNAQNDYNQAKQNADNIQSAISHQQDTVANDQQNINNDSTQISGLNSTIANDKTAISDTQTAISNVGQKAQDDQAQLNRDESSLTDAQNQKATDENNVNNIQNEINYLPVADTIPSWDKSYMGNPNSTSANQTFTDDEVNSDMQTDAQMRSYLLNHNNPELNYYVNADNLSDNDLKILNEQIITFLNQYRKQLGLTPLEYNSEAANIAVALAHVVDKDNAYGTDDPNEFNTLENDYHLSSPSIAASCGINNSTHLTMNNLVNQCLNLVRETLYNDTQNDLGHMHTLLDSGNVLMGFACDAGGGLHYVAINLSDNPGLIGDTNIPQDPSIFDGKSEVVPDVSQLQSDLANAKQKVADDDTAIQQLQNAVANDKAQLAQDTPTGLENQLSQQQAKLAQDTQALQDAQNRKAMDEQKLTQDENTLSQLQQEATNPQQVLTTLATKVAQTKSALDDANNAVAQAQQAYNDAENNLKQQQQILADDQAQLAKDEATLKDLQQQAQDYADAPQKLADAQQKLAQDTQKLQQDEAKLSQLEAQLATDKANEAQAQQAYQQALAKLNADKAELAKQEAMLDPTTKARMASEARVNSYNKAFAKVEQASGVTTVKADTISGDKTSVSQLGSVSTTVESTKAEKASDKQKSGLPDTGDSRNERAEEAGMLALGGAGLLAMFGLGRKRRKEAHGRHF